MKSTDTPSKTQAFFEIARDKEGGWHWMFFSPNGRRIATNVVPLASKKDCRRIIGAMVVQMAATTVICEKDGTPDEDEPSEVPPTTVVEGAPATTTPEEPSTELPTTLPTDEEVL